MKKIIISILILLMIIVGTVILTDILIIDRNEAIEILENSKLKNSNNVKVIEIENSDKYENYTRETSKLGNIEYCKITMAGDTECNYINWVNISENKDTVVFINEKVFNSSTMEIEPILVNYSQKAAEFLKDTTYKYKKLTLENIGEKKCYVFRVYKSDEIAKNYEEIKVWIDKETGDCMKYEYYLNEGDFLKPEIPESKLEFTYEYDSVKIEEIKEPVESDYPDFRYTYLY